MSAESERLDRLEAIVAKTLNVDFSEFDTPNQAKARAKEIEQNQKIQAKQQAVEQKEAGVTAAEDRIAAEQAAGKKSSGKVDVPQLTAGPGHLLTDGTTGGPQPSTTGKPKAPSSAGKPKSTSSRSTSSKKPEASASSSSSKSKG